MPAVHADQRPQSPVVLALLLILALVAGCSSNGSDQSDTSAESAAPAEQFAPEFTSTDCFGHEAEDVECGTVAVPLHHDEPDGETLDLAVVVLPAEDPATDLPPVVLLGGGPGQAMVQQFLTTPEVRQLFALGPPVIVFDQRGAGHSRPQLACPELEDLATEGVTGLDATAATAALVDCGERLDDEGVDLSAFTTPANAADVDLVRRALDHEQVIVWGTSYGSLLGQLVAERFPDSVSALVLSSPVDPGQNWVAAAATGFDGALDEVAQACRSTPDCADRFPPLDENLDQVISQLAAEPVEVTVDTPAGEQLTLRYTPELFAAQLFALFYGAPLIATLPAIADAAADGDLRPLAEIVAMFAEAQQGSPSLGMYYSMTCSGEAADLQPSDFREDVDRPLVADHWLRTNVQAGEPVLDICRQWPVEEAYQPEPLSFDAPTLLITGRFDHVTPPSFGEAVAERLDTAHLIEVPVGGHSPLEQLGPCGQQIVRAFLEQPRESPDDTCATGQTLQFAAEPALPRPPG